MGGSPGADVGVVAVIPNITRNDGSPSRNQDTVRATEMAAAYLSGETLQSIGDRYGVTRERVRQICTRQGVKKAAIPKMARFVTLDTNDPRWRYAWSSAGIRWWKAHHKGKAIRRAHVAAIRAYVAETGDTKPSGPTVHHLTGTRSDVMLARWWGRPSGPAAPYTKYLNRLRKLAGITARDAGWRGHLKRTEEVS